MYEAIKFCSRSFLLISAGLALIACAPAQGGAEKAHEPDLHAASHAASDHTEPSEAADTPELNVAAIRSAESHSHGGAVLSVAAENSTIVMELETPLYNLLGFEYEPKTPEEKARVIEVETGLALPETLFRFNSEAGCTYDKTAKKIALFDEHSDHDLDDDHDTDHDDHDTDHEDVILEYALQCKAMGKLKKLEVTLFEEFPFFKELELVYLGPSQQMSAELSSSRPNADLTR